jgi:hypothetical protein
MEKMKVCDDSNPTEYTTLDEFPPPPDDKNNNNPTGKTSPWISSLISCLALLLKNFVIASQLVWVMSNYIFPAIFNTHAPKERFKKPASIIFPIAAASLYTCCASIILLVNAEKENEKRLPICISKNHAILLCSGVIKTVGDIVSYFATLGFYIYFHFPIIQKSELRFLVPTLLLIPSFIMGFKAWMADYKKAQNRVDESTSQVDPASQEMSCLYATIYRTLPAVKTLSTLGVILECHRTFQLLTVNIIFNLECHPPSNQTETNITNSTFPITDSALTNSTQPCPTELMVWGIYSTFAVVNLLLALWVIPAVYRYMQSWQLALLHLNSWELPSRKPFFFDYLVSCMDKINSCYLRCHCFHRHMGVLGYNFIRTAYGTWMEMAMTLFNAALFIHQLYWDGSYTKTDFTLENAIIFLVASTFISALLGTELGRVTTRQIKKELMDVYSFHHEGALLV